VRWLANTNLEPGQNWQEKQLGDLLEHVESFENYLIVSKDISLMGFWAISNPSDGTVAPRVIILTETGSPSGKVIRVTTELDRLSIYRAINPATIAKDDS
jgi:hypothetical protein